MEYNKEIIEEIVMYDFSKGCYKGAKTMRVNDIYTFHDKIIIGISYINQLNRMEVAETSITYDRYDSFILKKSRDNKINEII